MTTVWTLLTKLEITLVSLLSAQAVLVAFFPQTPVVLQWVSRVFGVLGFIAAVVKIILLANGQPVPAKPNVR
jgi:hypothetical protein